MDGKTGAEVDLSACLHGVEMSLVEGLPLYTEPSFTERLYKNSCPR